MPALFLCLVALTFDLSIQKISEFPELVVEHFICQVW